MLIHFQHQFWQLSGPEELGDVEHLRQPGQTGSPPGALPQTLGQTESAEQFAPRLILLLLADRDADPLFATGMPAAGASIPAGGGH